MQTFLPSNPILLAPLAGVSDIPMRRISQEFGADLTYVEMLSSEAILHDNELTFRMMKRHKSESVLGVQLTGSDPKRIALAVSILDKLGYDTIDLNMGCPVRKVVKTGCGSAQLKNPEKVYQTVLESKKATNKPLSVKIRTGWNHDTVNALEVASAIQSGGADWMCVHGRTRADDYSVPVNLELIKDIKDSVSIPVIGNGNIFDGESANKMKTLTGVDGLMVSRGALGHPWIFSELKNGRENITLNAWKKTVLKHIDYQEECYKDAPRGGICMRKTLLWYMKGWTGVKPFKDKISTVHTLADARVFVDEVVAFIFEQGQEFREPIRAGEAKFWEPKWEMSREHDRGVGGITV